MSKEKTSQLVSGIILLLLGVLIAIFGGQAVLDTYFGIVAIICGAVLLGLAIYQMAKKSGVNPLALILGCVLIAIGIALFTPFLSFSIIINILVIVILGVGAGLVCLGIYMLAKKDTVNGLINVIVGIVLIVLAVLYINVADFRKAFWIIVGILVAVYGVFEIINATIGTKRTTTTKKK